MKRLRKLLVSLLGPRLSCRVGLHDWDDPHYKELIKSTGLHIVFFTSGIQKGERRCRGCSKLQKCFREGVAGIGGSAGEWQPMTPSTEEYIDSLPTL